MVLTRSMKNQGITSEDKSAANILVQLNKDNAILKNLKSDMEKDNLLHAQLEKAQEELHILKQIKQYGIAKQNLENIIHNCNVELEGVSVELASLYSALDDL